MTETTDPIICTAEWATEDDNGTHYCRSIAHYRVTDSRGRHVDFICADCATEPFYNRSCYAIRPLLDY